MKAVSQNLTIIDNRKEVSKAMFYANKASTRKAGRIVAKEAKANMPVASGATKKSIGVKTWQPKRTGRLAGGEQRGFVRADVGYWSPSTLEDKGKPKSFAKASWVENGTKPHEIKAGQRTSRGDVRIITGKKLLSNGTTKFGKKFWHPGAKPKKPLQNAAQAKAYEVAACAQEYYKKLSELYKKPDSFFTEIAAAAGGDGDTEDGD